MDRMVGEVFHIHNFILSSESPFKEAVPGEVGTETDLFFPVK